MKRETQGESYFLEGRRKFLESSHVETACITFRKQNWTFDLVFLVNMLGVETGSVKQG